MGKPAAALSQAGGVARAGNDAARRRSLGEGDNPVFAYIASLPQPQRAIAEAVDALATATLLNLQRSVKWGMSYYGIGGA